jgi:nucleosome assembly protein 1-like 1
LSNIDSDSIYKYAALYAPIFDRRRDITLGHAAPTAEEIALGEEQSRKDDGDDYSPLPPSSPTVVSSSLSPANPGAGVPSFWLNALRNHVGISELITDRDAEALKYLVDIRVSYLPAKDSVGDATSTAMGFTLSCVFSRNDFFEDEVLTKTYVYRDELGYEGDFVYEKAVGCNIKWKDEKDLTKSCEIRKQRNKSKYMIPSHLFQSVTFRHIDTNCTRLIRKAQPVESFFNFFNPPVPPPEEAIEQGEIDDEELEDLEERLELDYQIGEDLKERVRIIVSLDLV